MIENIIVCLIIALLIKTTDQRNYLGFLVLSYYAIFILIDIEFFGFQIKNHIFSTQAVEWSVFMIVISLFYSALSIVLYKRGSNIAGLYATWLIISATVTLLEAADTNNVYLVELMYNVNQSANLLVELLVVILGTDNALHRIKHSGRCIDSVISFIDNMCNKTLNFSDGSAKK